MNFGVNLKLKSTKQKETKNDQIINIYAVLNKNDCVVINEMDIVESCLVEISGIHCETGGPPQELINSRTNEPEIVIDVIDK